MTALAPHCDWPYLRGMAQPVQAQQDMLPAARAPNRAASVIVWSAAVVGALIVLGAAALWMQYGTAVFFEMIAAGFAACF